MEAGGERYYVLLAVRCFWHSVQAIDELNFKVEDDHMSTVKPEPLQVEPRLAGLAPVHLFTVSVHLFMPVGGVAG